VSSTTPATSATKPTGEAGATSETTKTPSFIVENDVTTLSAGQMRKKDFLAELRRAINKAVEPALAGTGRTTKDCPYLVYWFGYYESKDAADIQRAIRKYAPETTGAHTADVSIGLITMRVFFAVSHWLKTGEITGVPEGIPTTVPGASGGSKTASAGGRVAAKAREGGVRSVDNPRAIQARLGEGRPLDSGVRSRMQSAFGMEFSHVRTHTDTTAAGLSNRMNARAFTVGNHVAFGSGEYCPGTPVGDALIAHEIAHVVQQHGSSESVAPLETNGSHYNVLEDDADRSAMGVMASLWGGAKGKLGDVARNAVPRLRSGLRLQRCPTDKCNKRFAIDMIELYGSRRDTERDLAVANNIFTKCAVTFYQGSHPEKESEETTRSWLLGGTHLPYNWPHVVAWNLWMRARKQYRLRSPIQVFYVGDIPGDTMGFNITGTGFVAIENAADENTLAHELGHVFGLEHEPTAKAHLMYGRGVGQRVLDNKACEKVCKKAKGIVD